MIKLAAEDPISEPMLKLSSITKHFPGVTALKGVDFDLTPGEVHALVGENGAGKSTLIKIIMRHLIEDEGEIWFKGESLKSKTVREVELMGISAVHQDLNLVPSFTVAQNILLNQERTTRFGTIRWAQLCDKAQKYLDLVSMTVDVRTPVEKLSPPEQQLIAIARALSREPDVLVLDEPTARMGRKETEVLISLIRDLKARNIGVVFISHRLEEIFEVADRVTVLRNGEKVGTFKIDDVDEDQLVRYMIGRRLAMKFPIRTPTIGGVKFEAQCVSVPAKGIRDFRLEVREGEIVGIVGMVGAGKSEIARALFGAEPGASTELKLNGKPITVRSPVTAVRQGLALVPENRREEGLVGEASVKENLTLSSLGDYCKFEILIRTRVENKVVREVVQKLGIRTPSINQKVSYLSGGNQQKVILGRWLLTKAEAFIFDEPTKGIDVGAKTEIYKLINDLAVAGKAIIYITNEIQEALGICDRILVMHRGRVTAQLDAKQTSYEEVLAFSFGLERKDNARQ